METFKSQEVKDLVKSVKTFGSLFINSSGDTKTQKGKMRKCQ
jgi:hypothetical protein